MSKVVAVEVPDSSVLYVIEAQCKYGCDSHQPGEWRSARMLPSGFALHEARQAMWEHAHTYPRSKPYRLVEVVVLPDRIRTLVDAV